MVNVVLETIFRVLSSLTSISVTLSLTPSIYRIHKQKHTGIASVLPLVCMMANAHIWMMDGIIVRNWFPMFATFLTSDFIAMGYIAVYLWYTPERKKTLRVVGTGVAILALISVYAILGGLDHTHQSNDSVDMTLGILGVIAGLSMFSSPLERIKQVLKYKSAAFIPIPLVVAGALNNIMWVVYCPMIDSWFLFSGNAACLLVGTVSLTLYAIYNPKTHPLRLEENAPAAPDDLLIEPERLSLSVLGSPCVDGLEKGRKATDMHSPVYTAVRSPLAGLLKDKPSSRI